MKTIVQTAYGTADASKVSVQCTSGAPHVDPAFGA
jgi:hypothetical protein